MMPTTSTTPTLTPTPSTSTTAPPLIKLCGFTRAPDVQAAIDVGANFIGFVCYPKSPRFVSPQRAGELAALLPASVTPVLLFVNAPAARIRAALVCTPNAVLQFHGEESLANCQQFGRPFWKVARVPTGLEATHFDLLQFNQQYRPAQAILLDAKIDTYGGAGRSFDWTALPWSHPELNANRRLILSGGLTPANVANGIHLAKPWAVDISSGIECSAGIKDHALIFDFAKPCAAHKPSQPHHQPLTHCPRL